MYIIDRFEGEYAVCERQSDGTMVNISRSRLPEKAAEGSCIELIGGEYVINYEKTEELKKKIEDLTKDMWK